ncbi:unnamed protein product [Paramecium sonneborni]|uniref:Transmembrane protein n=1 Tax=Paramecium sonneborni TaxID=65129 RepID=A0A8S1RB44_9CILI|nr:unnamed protein product [Paramecium sonneborni]
MKYIQMADIFGVPYKQQITLKEKVQKSILGGISSIILILVGFAYLIYVMNQWINNNILPKSTSTMKVDNYSEILFDNEQLFEFCYWKYDQSQVDPFRMKRNILTPIGIYFIGGIPQKPFSLLQENQKQSAYNTTLMSVDNLQLIQNSNFNKELNATKELMILIASCNETLLNVGYECASKEEIEDFFKSSVNYISFRLNLKQYDPYNQQFEIVKKEYYLSFDYEIAQQGQLILTQTKATIDTGIIFGKFDSKSYVYNAQQVTSSTSKNFWQTLLVQESYLNLFIRLDPMSYDTQIVYPKLGEILAQVGSIINMLMIIQYAIYHYNERILDCDFIDKVLKFYFYDYADLKKSKNKIDQEACQELIQQARKKLVYTNIIYELSRIQLFLLNYFGRNLLEQTHNLGLSAKGDNKPNCELYDKFITIPRNDNQQQNIQFDKADFNLLCRAKSKTLIIGNINNNNNNIIGDSGRIFSEMKSSSLKSIQT